MKTKHLTGVLFLIGLFFTAMASAQTCAPTPSSGLVAWYRAENNTVDSAGGNNGTQQGGVSYTAGMVGQAFSLNGTDAYVQAPSTAANDPTMAGSQEAWVKFNQLPSVAGHIMEIIGKGGGGTDFDLQAETDNRFRFFIDGSVNVVSTTVIQTGVWYHVAGTWDSTGLRIYVNGTLENTNGIQNLTRSQSNQLLEIGNQPYFGPRLFSGLIDEASIYNRALTAAEVQSIYNAGSAGKCLAGPTASSVSIGGRVMNARGRGISNAIVSLTDPFGNVQTARTNLFGFYRFTDVPAGATYILSVSAKRYKFQNPTLVLSLAEETTDVNFTAY